MATNRFPTPRSSTTNTFQHVSGANSALWLGVLFCAVLTGLIWLLGDRLAAFPKLPDQGTLWYYWKLSNPTWVTRLSAWGLYLVHQIANFALIRKAQRAQLT